MNDKTREKLYKIYSDYEKAKISNKKPVNNELKEKIIQLSAIFTTTCKHDKNKYKDVIAIIKKYLKSNFPEFTAAFIKEEQNQFILNKAYKITKDINNKQNYNKEHKEYFSKNINYILEQIEDETREKLYKIYSDYENNGSVDAKIKDEIICLTITLNTSIERQRQLIKECQNHSSIEAILKSYLTDNFPGYAVKK